MTEALIAGGVVLALGVLALLSRLARDAGRADALRETEANAREDERKAAETVARRLDPGTAAERLRDGSF